MTMANCDGIDCTAVMGSIFRANNLASVHACQRPPGDFPVAFQGKTIRPAGGYWKTGLDGLDQLVRAEPTVKLAANTLNYVRYLDDFPVTAAYEYLD